MHKVTMPISEYCLIPNTEYGNFGYSQPDLICSYIHSCTLRKTSDYEHKLSTEAFVPQYLELGSYSEIGVVTLPNLLKGVCTRAIVLVIEQIWCKGRTCIV